MDDAELRLRHRTKSPGCARGRGFFFVAHRQHPQHGIRKRALLRIRHTVSF
ncbi:MAG TPA: hypothetical protein VEQ60_26840 [Longimicrobium sp.]|nr:hypothetical protein [Longimicrobium sp.]